MGIHSCFQTIKAYTFNSQSQKTSTMVKPMMFAAAVLAFACIQNFQLTGAKSLGSSCTPGKYECEATNDDYFCHYERKRCERRNSGCSVTTEQRWCLGGAAILGIIENNACDKGTNACRNSFDALVELGKQLCNVGLDLLCDLDDCPENKGQTKCLEHRHAL